MKPNSMSLVHYISLTISVVGDICQICVCGTCYIYTFITLDTNCYYLISFLKPQTFFLLLEDLY